MNGSRRFGALQSKVRSAWGLSFGFAPGRPQAVLEGNESNR